MKSTFILLVFITIILKRNYLYALATKRDLLQDPFENHRAKRQADTCTIPQISNGIVNILRQRTSSNTPASSYLLLNVTCTHNYVLYPPNNNIILCINGFWDQDIPQCILCGQRLDSTHKPFIVNGTLSKFGDFPWHAGIYRKDPSDSDPLYLCGGSLINSYSILTVAHCFTDESGKLKESSNYYVAAGKYYSSYNNDKDKYAQKRKAHTIDIHPRYKGYFTNYAWDIAVVLVNIPFEISNLVQPICVDWTNDFENEQLIPNNYGEVAGWGSTETNLGKAAHELRVLKVPFINAEKCTNLVPKTFIRYITPDKFCAGYTNGSSVCGGDSGNGLVFPREENRDTRYYIRGLVSVGVQIDGRCDDYKYSTYTKVSEYLSFVKESIEQVLVTITTHADTFVEYNPIVPCLTPNSEHAKCISIYECQIFVDALKNKPTPETQKFMQNSRCSGVNEIDVCCGSTTNYLSTIHSNPVTTKPVTHKNLNLLPPPGVCGRQVRLRQARIFGGNVTTLLDFPWMVLLEFGSNETNFGLFCAGTVINERYVLTAAHCVSRTNTNITGPAFRVRLGEYNTNTEFDCVNINEGTGNLPNGKKCADPIVHVDIERIIIHPLFKDEPLGANDIALLRLSKNINYTDFIKPICLPLNGEKSLSGAQMVIAGWGRTEQGKFSPIKRKAFVPVVSDEECGKIYKEKANVQLEISQICAGGVRGIDSCTGDTGGVLMRPLTDSRDMYAEGIISFGARYCGTEGIPGVATRVSHFIEWILNTIEP